MSTSTTIAIDRHLSTLEIPDAAGLVQHYLMSPAAPGLDDWAITLTRTDGKGEWRVAVDALGRWRCSCPDWTHRRRRNRGHTGPCKHMEAARDLFALVTLLSLSPGITDVEERDERRNVTAVLQPLS